ncbi:MAG: tetratricopeptide repeat protein, partial [Deltaproteobacteria bacterium]|nr:tetratricopeptide repeat protein [Deltaproteobacteria bacterium]
FFILGLLSKPMVVTLPFILLLLDFWPLKRFQLDVVLSAPQWHTGVDAPTHGIAHSNQPEALSTTTPVLPSHSILYLIREKIPLMALSAISCAVALFAQHSSGTVRSLEVMPLASRAANALISYVTYIGQMIFPLRLAVFYPYAANTHWWKVAGALCILISISYLAWQAVFKHPYILFGWLWYLGTLLPVIGIVQVGAQKMADRYTYVPLIGLFVLIIWGAVDFAKIWRYRKAAISSGAMVILGVVTILTWVQISYWKNSVALFSHAVEVTSDNYLAHNNLGNALTILGKNDEAMSHYTAALRIYPNYADAHYNMGRILTNQRQIDEAIRHYSEALKLNPQLKEAHYNLGLLMAQKGKNAEAVRHFSHALQLDHNYAEAHNNLGVMQMQQKRIKEAILHFQTAVRLKPGYETAKRNLDKSLNANTLN